MRPGLFLLSAVLLAGSGASSSAYAAPAKTAPLVNAQMGSAFKGQVETVKKRSGDDEGDGGEKGWFDYLKMAMTFESPDNIADEVADGRLVEHIIGGFFASLGGHIWAPQIAYKDIDERPSAAMTLGIISTILAWSWLPWLLIWWIPYVGWVLVSLIILVHVTVVAVFNYWFIPRAIQFAYSDAYGSGGGSKKSKKKKKKADDDDEE